MTNRFTQKAQNTLNRSLTLARDMGHMYVGSEHLLLAMLVETDSIAARMLEKFHVRYERFRKSVTDSVGMGEKSSVTASDMTPRLRKIIANSAAESARAGHAFIGTEHLLLALTEESDCEAVRILREQGISAEEIRTELSSYFFTGEEPAAETPRRAAEKGNTHASRSNGLNAYGRDLCTLAKSGRIDPVIGREEETERVIRILCRRTKNNPCLIGEPGVGKTAVVEGLARQIAIGDVPEILQGRTVVMLDITSMIAGAKYRGEFEERMKSVLAEATGNKRVILFIDEIHTIIGAGGAEGAMDAANILKPALARGEIQLIGATTADEYRRHIERDAALERRFQAVHVSEPSEERAREILCGLRDRYEAHHRLNIDDDAIEAAVRLSARYIPDRRLPDKAIDLIDEAAAGKRMEAAIPSPEVRHLSDALRQITRQKEKAILSSRFEEALPLHAEEKTLQAELMYCTEEAEADDVTVTAADVARIVTAWTGIPVAQLAEEEGEKLRRLEATIASRVIGQEEAVRAVSRAIRRGRTGLKDPTRPIGSFLFLGPSGVGKTKLARVLAETMYGGEEALLRFDMSEYMEKISVSSLIGSPPGYVGYGEGGQLTGRVRHRPYSVVLFDEIEKAHPDVFHLLLQILEDGVLRDAQGRMTDFRNTVIIMTSNVGASEMKDAQLGFSSGNDCTECEQRRLRVHSRLRGTFRPELLNRIDEIIVFDALSRESIREIAEMMLADVTRRIAGCGISIRFSESVAQYLAETGADRSEGARPLRRAVVRQVEDTLADAMISGQIQPGDRLEGTLENGSIRYRKAEPVPSPGES